MFTQMEFNTTDFNKCNSNSLISSIISFHIDLLNGVVS